MKEVKNLDALFAALKAYGFNAWDIKQYLDDNKKHIVFPLIPEEVEMEAKFLRKRLQKQIGESMKLDEAINKLEQAGYLTEKTTEEDKARLREEAKKKRALLHAIKQANTADKLIAAIQALKAEYGDNLAVEFDYYVNPSLWLSGETNGEYQWTLEFSKKEPKEWEKVK